MEATYVIQVLVGISYSGPLLFHVQNMRMVRFSETDTNLYDSL